MYRHILIPTDGSELSEKAIEHGVAFAKSINARITALTVSIPFHIFTVTQGMTTETLERYKERMETVAARYLSAVKNTAIAAAVRCDMVHVEHDQPYRAILDTAARRLCDLIVMGSHGRRGVSAIVLGSETVKVLTHSSIPVLVFRAPRPAELFAA